MKHIELTNTRDKLLITIAVVTIAFLLSTVV
jgi:hypothetical protein